MDTPTVSLVPGGTLILPLGIGTWAWGERMIWGYGDAYTAADVQRAFDTAQDAGITLFDTAELYGRGESERLLGSAMRASGQSAVIATKFFPYPWRLTEDALLTALEGSLGRLRVPRVDLYQIHWPTPLVPAQRWIRGLARAVAEGMTAGVGVSNYSEAQMRTAHAALADHGIPLASNQVRYSLLDRSPEHNGVLRACQELGVTLIAYSPLAQGLLTGKYSPTAPPHGAFRGLRTRATLRHLPPLTALLQQIGQAHGGKSPAQVSLNWLICKGSVPIPGAKNARQAADNAGALGWRLSAEEVAMVDRASERVSSLSGGQNGARAE